MAKKFLVTVETEEDPGVKKFAWIKGETLSKCSVDLMYGIRRSEHLWKSYEQIKYFDSAEIKLPIEFVQ